MSRKLNIVVAAALALTLALTGQAMAQLRVAPGPAGIIEICTGSGPVRVLAGKDGAPLGAAHICPDCAPAALSGILPPAVMPLHVPRVSRLAAAPITVHLMALAGVRPSARSPPAEGRTSPSRYKQTT